MAKRIVAYRVMINEDSVEGRGRMIPLAYFTTKPDAHACAQGRGPMGASDGEVEQITVFCSYADWLENHKTLELRQRALNKLTKEEREALGL